MRATLADAEAEGITPDTFARRWRTLAVLCGSLLTVMLANSSMNLALPMLARDLGLTQLELTWVVETYTLTFAALLFVASAIADRYGRRATMQVGIGVFAVAALYAAFVAGSGPELIAARAAMGLGAALVMPTTLSVVNVVFPSKERPRAIAVWSAIAGVGMMLGNVITGLLLNSFSWHSVFIFNGVVAVLALVGNVLMVPESRDDKRTPVDWLGGALVTVALLGVVYAIMEAPSHGLSQPLTMSALIVGGLALATFLWWETRTDHPMLDLALFKKSSFGLSALALTLTFFALMGAFFSMSQIFQLIMGYSPLLASVAFIPVMLPMMAFGPLVPNVVARIGAKATVSLGLLTVSGGFVLMSSWPVHPSYWQVVGSMAVMIGGMIFAMTPATNLMMAAVPKNRSGMGSAMNDTTRQLGGALGIAVLGSLISSVYTDDMAATAATLPGEAGDAVSGSLAGALVVAEKMGDAGLGIAQAAAEAFMHGTERAMLVSAGIALLAAIVAAIGLPNRTPEESPAEDEAAVPAA